MYSTWTIAAALMLTAATAFPAFAAEGMPMTLLQSGCRQMNRGNYNSAVEIFSTAIRQNPSDLGARRQLSCALIGAGREREAIQQLRLVVAIEPGNASDLCTMAEASRRLGDDRSAATLYKQAISADAQCNGARMGLARLLMGQGNYRAAQAVCWETLRTSRDPALRRQTYDLLTVIKTQSLLQKVERSG